MTFNIEPNIKPKDKGWSVNKFPFGQMQEGDSFFYSGDNLSCLRNAASVYGIRYGKKFSVRKEKDCHGKNGARCYRVW